MGSYTPLCKPDCLCSGGVVPEGALASCIALRNLRPTMSTVFGFQSFLPGQLEAMLPALHGKDVFVRMDGYWSWQKFGNVPGASCLFQRGCWSHH